MNLNADNFLIARFLGAVVKRAEERDLGVMEPRGVERHRCAGGTAAEEQHFPAREDEIGQQAPYGFVARAVDGRLGRAFRAVRERFGRLAIEVDDLSAVPPRDREPFFSAARRDGRRDAAQASRGGPQETERPGPVDEKLSARPAEPAPAVEDRRERIEESGGLVGHALGDGMEASSHH